MTRPVAAPAPFPAEPPPDFETIGDEPAFDPARHLALERPAETVSLAAFGYDAAAVAAAPSAVAVTSAFRVLSDEGAACMQEVARKLSRFASSNARIDRNVRGGVYRSKFLRDFCLSPEVTEAMSDILGAPMTPHSMPHQLGHLNYNPFDLSKNVDKWHCDTLKVDFVMFVTDPNAVEGGAFEYFRGTRDEVQAIKARGEPLPKDKIVAPYFPGAGYAVLQQGDLVTHRAKGLTAPGERITLVNGYIPADLDVEDYTRFDQLALADPIDVSAVEYARHIAWRGGATLDQQLNGIRFGDDRMTLADDFDRLAGLLSAAARDLRAAGTAPMEHFGDE